ncbi:MAG TPA: hypothetical protein ENF24_03220 [Methanosarcinales archaeon]|nr:hypothetical protein [Methanosarcinales archaeon]
MIKIPVETFIVRLTDPITKGKIESFAKNVMGRGGRVELVTNKGCVISIDNGFADELRALPSVRLLGGVNLRRREVRVTTKVV